MKEVSNVGIVVIGRNEGDRLDRCFQSMKAQAATMVYVDSSSTDGSVSLARKSGVEVVELKASTPFTAARARNAGFERLLQLRPDVQYVFFIDGDCEMDANWLDRACQELEQNLAAAVVCGRLRERFPEQSLFHRLAELEWDCPAGEVESCGGVFVIRARAFEEVGRFNPSIAAGEEPELCWRLRRAQWKIVRLQDEMAWHDLAMDRFSQWWKRETRLGWGGFDVWLRTGKHPSGPFADNLRSAWRWGAIWPLATLIVSFGGWWFGGIRGAATFLLLGILAWVAQVARMTIRGHDRGLSWPDSMAYGILNLLGKWGQLYGRARSSRHTATLRHSVRQNAIPSAAAEARDAP